MSITNAYKNSIVLQIDESTRTIINNGTNTPIVLGVKGDDCAERVYFECPVVLSPEINLLEAKDIEGNEVKVYVYVNYKSATNDSYIQECIDVAEASTSDRVVFSWLVTNNATEKTGNVKFNICVKKSVAGVLTNEWHTTPFIGKVLDSIDVSRKTPEIITHDSVTMDALAIQVQAYSNSVNSYAASLQALNESLSDVENYIDGAIQQPISDEVDSKMSNYALKSEYLPLIGGSMTGSINMANNNGLSFSNGGFMGDQNGHPIISSKNGAVLFIGEEEYIPSWFVFPSGGGTLATEDYVNEATSVLEAGVYTTEVDGVVTAATKTSYFNGAIGLVDSSKKTYLLGLPLKNGTLTVEPTIHNIYGSYSHIIDISNLKAGDRVSKGVLFDIAAYAPTTGDRIKVYLAGDDGTELCNTAIIEFELIDTENFRDDLHSYAAAVCGRGCYIDSSGSSVKIISAEFRWQKGDNYKGGVIIGAHGLSDPRESYPTDELTLLKIELLKHS